MEDSQIKYTCKTCGKYFVSNNNLRVHERAHSYARPYSCEHCNWSFKQKTHLDRHLKTHSNESLTNNLKKCLRCGKCYSSFGSLISHELTVHNEVNHLNCFFCTTAFENSEVLAKHYREKHSKKLMAASHKIIFQEDKIRCMYCNDSFRNNALFDEHQRSHNETTDVHCSDCSLQFFQLHKLVGHIANNHWRSGNACYKCNKIFADEGSAKKHFRALNCAIFLSELKSAGVSPNTLKTYSCSICEMFFPTAKTLEKHCSTHTGEKPFCCTKCQKSFSTKGNFQQHLKTVHEGKKRRPEKAIKEGQCSFACKVCSRMFVFKCDLETHMRSHTGDKPYSCETCKRCFSQRGNLNIHINRYHKGSQKKRSAKNPSVKTENHSHQFKLLTKTQDCCENTFMYSQFKKSVSTSNYDLVNHVVIYPPSMQTNLDLLAETIVADFKGSLSRPSTENCEILNCTDSWNALSKTSHHKTATQIAGVSRNLCYSNLPSGSTDDCLSPAHSRDIVPPTDDASFYPGYEKCVSVLVDQNVSFKGKSKESTALLCNSNESENTSLSYKPNNSLQITDEQCDHRFSNFKSTYQYPINENTLTDFTSTQIKTASMVSTGNNDPEPDWSEWFQTFNSKISAGTSVIKNVYDGEVQDTDIDLTMMLSQQQSQFF